MTILLVLILIAPTGQATYQVISPFKTERECNQTRIFVKQELELLYPRFKNYSVECRVLGNV